MIFERLRVFVSSKMQELAPERQALKAALDALKVDAWVFEQDAGARPVSIERPFLEEVEAADLYIGLFWKGYGDYTIKEYEHARNVGKDCLIYEKRAALNGQRDPRLQAFLDRLGNVETGLTIKWFDDPLQLSEAIKDDIQRLQAEIYRKRGTPRINVSLSLAEKKERDDLLIILRKVKEFWVEGVLEKSVHGEALIDLGKEAWTEKTEHPWEQILELPDQTRRTIGPEEPIDKIFDDVGRSVLILGAPGSGKTITLLVLARKLISCAEGDPVQPIPVVFNLSSWTDPRQNFLDWLIAELLAKYQVPKRIGSRWLEANWIVPLLDGLDEVMTANQSACVEAINAYVQNHGAPGLAVCSRLKEYSDLPVRLVVNGAICLQPLSPDQVKDYVARSGDSLAGLNAALEKDRVLQTLAKTPMMLDVMSLAYRDLPAEELTNEPLNTEKERRSHLFDTYIDKMFIRKGKGAQGYAREQTLGWLSWLAQGMQQHGQTVFLIEQLQPSWLNNRGQKVVYMLGSRMVFGLIFGLTFGLSVGLSEGLVFGLIFGLVPGLIGEWRFNRGAVWERIESSLPRLQTVISVLVFGFSVGLSVGLMYGLIHGRRGGVVFGVIGGVIFGLIWGIYSRQRTLISDIQSVETLHWSWIHAWKGLVIGLLVGLVYFICGYGFSGVPVFGLIGGFFSGLRAGVIDIKAVPNLGIQLSMRNAVLAGGLGLLAYGLIYVPYFGLGVGLYGGLTFGLIAFFWYGGQDVIQHYILRLILHRKGYAPVRYANFLDYATRLVFLQRVGGGYIFIHRLLLEHFAAMSKHEKEGAPTSVGSPLSHYG
jgi:hypothetical protein